VSAGVTLWLELVSFKKAGSKETGVRKTELWTTTRQMAHLRAAGNVVVLWPDKDFDSINGPQWEVCRRFWDASGHAHLELAKMVIDAPEDAMDAWANQAFANIKADRPGGHGRWSTRFDDDPRPSLERGRWRDYANDRS
jgi:hypothetical protein